MKNLIGYLLLPALLFSTIFLSPSYAASINPSSTIEYNYINDSKTSFNLNVTLNNNSSLPSVINYFTLYLPMKNPNGVIVTVDGKKYNYTKHQKGDVYQYVIDLNNLIIGKGKEKSIKIYGNFQPIIGEDFSYIKLPAKFGDISSKYVKFSYPIDMDKPVGYSEHNYIYSSNATFHLLDFKNPVNDSISIQFGKETQTFYFEISKTFINYDEEDKTFDLIIPQNSKNNTVIIDQISPDPTFVKENEDGNIMVGFNVLGKDQEIVSMRGYIINSSKEETQTPTVKEDKVGYWTLTDEKELLRVKTYIDEHKGVLLAENLKNYVVDSLNLAKLNEYSIENSLRGGVNMAITRKGSAIAEDYCDLLIALLRNNNIPARMIVGYVTENSTYSSEGFFHSWVEYYEGNKWKILDPAIEDLYKVSDVNFSYDHVALITRESNAITPKLILFDNDEFKIEPSTTFKELFFQPVEDNNGITNKGNSYITVKTDSNSYLLIPDQSIKISSNAVVTDELGNSKEFDSSIFITDEVDKYLYEILSLILFLILITSSLLVYDRIKHKWKGTKR